MAAIFVPARDCFVICSVPLAHVDAIRVYDSIDMSSEDFSHYFCSAFGLFGASPRVAQQQNRPGGAVTELGWMRRWGSRVTYWKI